MSGTERVARSAATFQPTPFAGRQLGALARLHLTYLWRHRRALSLAKPARFTELVKRRKLIDRDRRLPGLVDKVAVKGFVAEVLGSEWVTPTMWSGTCLPLEPEWPAPFVVKSRHGCNQLRFVRSCNEDWAEITRSAQRWLRSGYGYWLDEWAYRGIERGILVEPLVGDGMTLPVDYKLYVFGGKVRAIQVHLEREHAHRWILFDPDWRRLSAPSRDSDPPPPAALARMIAGAERLGRLLDFVRVDFYDVGPTPRFGELTFYPGSGLDPFDPPELDLLLGRYWLDAIASAGG